MYNSVGSTSGVAGVTVLADTGIEDIVSLYGALGVTLLALGGVVFAIGSRISKRKVNDSMG